MLIALSRIIATLISIGAIASIIYGIITLVRIKKCTKVDAYVIDMHQEYTARGFMWRKYVEYEYDGQKIRYITHAKTRNRKIGVNKTLYITKRGNVLEVPYEIERIVTASIMLVLSTTALVYLWRL